jgi:hypothetical protein
LPIKFSIAALILLDTRRNGQQPKSQLTKKSTCPKSQLAQKSQLAKNTKHGILVILSSG